MVIVLPLAGTSIFDDVIVSASRCFWIIVNLAEACPQTKVYVALRSSTLAFSWVVKVIFIPLVPFMVDTLHHGTSPDKVHGLLSEQIICIVCVPPKASKVNIDGVTEIASSCTGGVGGLGFGSDIEESLPQADVKHKKNAIKKVRIDCSIQQQIFSYQSVTIAPHGFYIQKESVEQIRLSQEGCGMTL